MSQQKLPDLFKKTAIKEKKLNLFIKKLGHGGSERVQTRGGEAALLTVARLLGITEENAEKNFSLVHQGKTIDPHKTMQ